MQPKRHAILIANQDYGPDSGFSPLKCPLRDAEAMREVMSDPAYGGFDNVTVLPNRTRTEILMAFKDTLDQAGRDDLIFIYFSGHGQTDEEGVLYLAASDTTKSHLEATGIPSQTISNMIRRSRVSKKALVLDCCYAGAFTRSWKSGETIVADRMQKFARGSGTYVLMATGELSLAEEDPEHGLSILTRHLVDGLRGNADADRDGIVTIRELSGYIFQQVTRLHAQRPTEGGLDIQGDVAISRSGFGSDAERKEIIRKKLLEWVAVDGITPAMFAEASDVLSRDHANLTALDQMHRKALDRIATHEISLGQFHSEWFSRPENEHRQQMPKPKPKPTPKPTQQDAQPASKPKTTKSVDNEHPPIPNDFFGGDGLFGLLPCMAAIAIGAGMLSLILQVLTEGRGTWNETIVPNAAVTALAIALWRWWNMRNYPAPAGFVLGYKFSLTFLSLIGVLASFLAIYLFRYFTR
ncbi:caspase domain-containing protein [Yoonia sp. R2-816]|uniref:caspase family protein n=1 Tax=Yoonia sp. R2-816 TaxID=3342638 RepID=UPI00372BC070